MGKKKEIENSIKPKAQIKIDCFFCEGSGGHFGKECGACDGTGLEKIRQSLQRTYNLKNKLPRTYNINPLTEPNK